MRSSRMHADEVETDPDLVRRLLAGQFPEWADLPIERVASSGTDHAMYRLGGELVVRLPRIHWAVGQAERDAEWLPRVAPHLPVAVPEVVALGEPAEGYPWRWGVQRWLPGVNPLPGAGSSGLAGHLGRVVRALHAVDTDGGPPSYRAETLADRDRDTRGAIAAAADELDVDAVTAAWDEALAAPATDVRCWIHCDLCPGNLLLDDGRLTAVIDWGLAGLGDPAVDLMLAWNLLPPEARPAFRAAAAADDAAWARARGWALSVALIQLPYYRETNPGLVAGSRHVIRQILAGRPRNGPCLTERSEHVAAFRPNAC